MSTTTENRNQVSKAYKVQVQRTARVETLGELSADTQDVWLVLHGYGQLAAYFIRHFRPLAQLGHFIIAPEGLSRFYLGDNKWERVGASWMTKADREDEIADQQGYLDAALNQLLADTPQKVRLHVLGFSQGAATAWRWADQTEQSISSLSLWAGSPPAEAIGLNRQLQNGMKLALAYGDSDPFVTPARVEQLGTLFDSLGLVPQRFPFQGGHTFHTPTLLSLAAYVGAEV